MIRSRRNLIGLAAALLACGALSCVRSTAPSPSEAGGGTVMKFTFDRADDPRAYSVGTVLMRAFDVEGNLLVPSTAFESNRETGVFELDFTVPAGANRVIVAEPRGSGLPAGGGKTESGIALQGRDTLDIPAGGRADSIVIALEPFIPDSLLVIGGGTTSDTLAWKKMAIATSHVVRYEEWSELDTGFVRFEVERGPEDRLGLNDIRSYDRSVLTAFQVASVNDISQSAFSDTLFYGVAPEPSAGHPLSGRVIDATSGDPVAGATVTAEGPVTRSATTDENGDYVIPDLPDGTYTTTVEQDGFVIDETEVVMDGAPAESDVVLSPSLDAGQFRAVLRWGAAPLDLDSHILFSDGVHIYFENTGSAVDSPWVNLDLDDTNGFGPETITISRLTTDGMYLVYNWSGEAPLTDSEAKVSVYTGDTLLRTYLVPRSGEGRWWHVFDIDHFGTITEVNSISVDFPSKTGTAVPPGTSK